MAQLKDLIVNGASRFIGTMYGNLTGNVTGNCSGSSGSCTGNAATATTASNCSGNSATATKLGTSTVGGSTQPIYLNGGSPTAIGYTIATSVPSGAVFTDTHYTNSLAIQGNGTTATTFSQNANKTLNIKAGSNVSISATTDAITINSSYTDTNTTYTFASGTGGKFTVTPSNGSAQTVTVGTASSQANSTKLYVTGVTAANAALNYNSSVYISTGNVLMGAAWNDFAENRLCAEKAGKVVCEVGDGSLVKASERLQAGASIVSDTFGMLIGPEGDEYAAIAVAGRVLVEVNENETYKAGDCVCADKDGKVSVMTREEIKEYPDRIVGIVSEIPTYDRWNETEVNGRIWVKVR